MKSAPIQPSESPSRPRFASPSLPTGRLLAAGLAIGAAVIITGCNESSKKEESAAKPAETTTAKSAEPTPPKAAEPATKATEPATKPAEPAANALTLADPGKVTLLPPLNLKPKLFCDLTGYCAVPDELALLPDKSAILVSIPNCLEYEKFTPRIALLDKEGKKTDWFVDLPLHPKTNKVHPMGMEFGPDGNLYICDNQYFDDKDHQSRILRVIMKDGKPAACEVAVEGTKLSNGIRFKGKDLYMTDTFFDLPDKRDQSGIWKFSLDEIGAGKPVVKVLPLAKDPHIITTFTGKPQPAKPDGGFDQAAGADGLAFDSAGNLYCGLFGDGQFFKITFNADGTVKSNTKIIDDPSFQCCDGIWCDQKTDRIYLANSARNSVHIYDARKHTFQMIWENDDNDGKDGLLDQPCTACLLGNKLVVVNFDMPFPGLKNTKHDDPITVSYFEMP